MNVCRIANTRFDRAVDITLEPRSFGDRRDFFGFKNSAGFGGIDRDEIGGFFLDNLYNIGGCPCAFVGHDRRIDALRHVRHLVDALHGLLHVEQIICLHPSDHLNGGLGRRITLIGIDADLDIRAEGVAHSPYWLHISFRIDTAFEFNRFDSFRLCLDGLFDCLFNFHQAKAMGDADSISEAAAQKLIGRHLYRLAGNVVESHIDSRLGIGIALHGFVHDSVNLFEAIRVLPLQGRTQYIFDDMHRGLRCFTEISAVISTPVLQNRRFAEAHYTLVGMHLDDDVNSDWGREARPLVHPAGWQANRYGFDVSNLHCISPTLCPPLNTRQGESVSLHRTPRLRHSSMDCWNPSTWMFPGGVHAHLDAGHPCRHDDNLHFQFCKQA